MNKTKITWKGFKTMTSIFHTIGIIGYHHNLKNINTCKKLYNWLKNKKNIKIIIEKKISNALKINNKNHNTIIGNLNDIGIHADLAIIVGGDGNMLRAATILAQYSTKIIGINQGKLGFLTDLNPNSALTELSNILLGNYFDEQRLLLHVTTNRKNNYKKIGTAINEVILHSHKIKHMIEFEVYINNTFTFSQRSDGLIISTPTGSTAYSLSAGGPILDPKTNAIILIPICPHDLSSRPIIVSSDSIISLKLSQKNTKTKLKIRCDNQISHIFCKKEKICIQSSKHALNLIHPKNYNYFQTLNIKLGLFKKPLKL